MRAQNHFQIHNITSTINMDRLAQLLDSRLSLSTTRFPRPIPQNRVRQFAFAQHARMLNDPLATVFTIEGDAGVCGLAYWTLLTWDTKMLGLPAARLELLLANTEVGVEAGRVLLSKTLEEIRKQGKCHLTARIDACEIATAQTLERAGFEFVDGIQTFSLNLADYPDVPLDPDNAVETRMFEEVDLDQILNIARRSYVCDRFHVDPTISRATADRMHEEWVLNSCRGTAADAVVVAVDGPKVLGYATCKLDREIRHSLHVGLGWIVLVATDESMRNKGVGLACTTAAIRWFQSRNVDLIQVGTQLQNIAAARLYERCGFRLTKNTLTLRKVVSDSTTQ